MVSHDFEAPQREELVSPGTAAGPPVTAAGEHLASSHGASLAVSMAPDGPDSILNSFDEAVVQTVLNARAFFIRALYNKRWKLFASWFSAQGVDPERCSVPVLLGYLQKLLDKGLSVSTVKV